MEFGKLSLNMQGALQKLCIKSIKGKRITIMKFGTNKVVAEGPIKVIGEKIPEHFIIEGKKKYTLEFSQVISVGQHWISIR